MTLTQKETLLLQDLKAQEQLCVDKYEKYSSDACDLQLKNLFSSLEKTEQQHLDSVSQILNGTVPSMGSGGNSGQSSSQQTIQPSYKVGDNNESKQKDSYLCSDALALEKQVSSVYNTSIFEFRNTNIRDVLNHIQKEEQQHGERIYNYMSHNGMYN